MRAWVVAAVLIGLVLAALAGTALLAWPSVRLATTGDALARVELPGYAGRVTAIDVHSADGLRVPVRLARGGLWPLHRLSVGQRLTVTVTTRRPGWAGWLVGHNSRRSFTIETPRAHLLGRWTQVKVGAPISVSFDTPVARVSLGGAPARSLPSPRAVVSLGLVARGVHSAGGMKVAAAARSWERLPAPVLVSWFPARPYPQLLAEPSPGTPLPPGGQLTLAFSSPVSDVLGTRRPRIKPALPGHWRLLDAHTLSFRPSGLGFGLGTKLRVSLPLAVHLAGRAGRSLSRSFEWQVTNGSTLRLQQLLAQLGYLPVGWQPGGAADVAATPAAQLAAALSPPPGQFIWRYDSSPPELRAIWRAGQPNQITRGAVMMFQDTHHLSVDALAGPKFWQALISDAIARKIRTSGYNYVYVHRSVPQSLNLWHNGKVILTSPGNTGVPAAPTQLGTFAVFEHIPVGTMSGTNPDGSHYNDPGIRYISYFNHGEAIHAFNRTSFGTPQSLGCVELPLASAAKVWPYTPIGTLVTVED